MTTQYAVLSSVSGQTLTAKLFTLAAPDTVAFTADSVTERTNAKGQYVCEFGEASAISGDHALILFSGSLPVASGERTFAGVDLETATSIAVVTDDAASIATILSQVGSLYDATIITTFTVGATTSTTAFDTDLTAIDNYYRDQQAVFLTGNLRGSVPIQVFLNANGVIQTGEAMVAAPDPGSTGVLISRHMHTVQAIQSGLATQAELVDTHLDVNANGIAIAALNDISPAQVNAEVLDVLNVDTFAELSAPPAATSSLRAKLTWLFMWARNKSTETATQRKLYADDTTTVVSTEAVSDDATTFTKGEAV